MTEEELRLLQMSGLLAPPTNPATPAPGGLLSNAVQTGGGILGRALKGAVDWAGSFGKAYKEGITTEEAIPLGLEGAMNMIGMGGPMAVKGAAGIGGGLLRGADQPGLISSRLPTAVKATEDPFTDYLRIDTDAMRRTPGNFQHNVGLLADTQQYPGMVSPKALRSGDPEEIARSFHQTSVDNLLHLHDAIPEAWRGRASMWYEGANKIAGDMGKKYGLPKESVAGSLAALSPQKDWFQNVSLADRTLSTLTNQGTKWTPQMDATVARIYAKPQYEQLVGNIRGRRLTDLEDPVEKAAWVRAYDEAHNPRSHNVVTPEGNFGDVVRTASGAPSGTGWGSFAEIAKAIQAAESGGDPRKLSELMGERHKVRSFFNNIIAPNSRMGDVTADTHAVAANMLQPLSGNTVPVAHNFKNSLDRKFHPAEGFTGAQGSAITGAQGTYGLNADAYRTAAEARGLLAPRQMQSITWEGVRGLFPDTFKTAGNVEDIRNIWRGVSEGQITAEQARRLVMERAGGIRTPSWVQQ